MFKIEWQRKEKRKEKRVGGGKIKWL